MMDGLLLRNVNQPGNSLIFQNFYKLNYNLLTMNNLKFSCILLLVLALLVNSQRGKMPPHVQRQSFQSQQYTIPPRKSSASSSSSSSNCQVVNGVNTCDSPKTSKSSPFNFFIVAIALTIVGFVYMKNRQINVIKDLFRRQMQKFEQKILFAKCKVKQKELNSRILEFQNTTFKMDDLRKDKFQHYKSEMRIVNIQKVKQRLYEIKYECKDINGQGYFQGLLAIVSQRQFALKLIKVYQKFTEMGRRTKDIKNFMFYQGRGNLKELTGQWHFVGYEDSESHSGTWKMIAL